MLLVDAQLRILEMEPAGPEWGAPPALSEEIAALVRQSLHTGLAGEARPDDYALTCAMWTGVHGIVALRISFPDFPWPPLPQQVALVCDAGLRLPATRARR